LKDFYDLVSHSGPLGILVAIIFAVSILSKALFTLKRSIGQDRKEFLDFWSLQKDKPDDLWLEVAVRHFFGTYLPAGLIRQIIKRHHPARALLDICESWDFFTYDQKSHSVKWKHKWHEKSRNRALEIWLFRILTIVFFIAAYVFLKPFFQGEVKGNVFIQGAWAFNFSSFCLASIARSSSLKTASEKSHQWLDLTR